jgi:protoporphyrinogen IX oxidase
MNYYTTIKALHIIFVVSWFAGLFYIVRLFIYHTEAQLRDAEAKQILSEQFCTMEKKLWWIITTPAMVLTLFFGVWMIVINPALLKAPWMHLKLGFVALLLVYHFACQRIMFQLFKSIFRWKSNGLRIWNELATLCLVAIVFLVVMKNELNWIWGTVGFFAVAIGLVLGIQLYKKLRKISR